MSEVLRNLHNHLSDILDEHVCPLFKPGMEFTLIVRRPGNDERDVLITSESDLNEIIKVIQRSISREVIAK